MGSIEKITFRFSPEERASVQQVLGLFHDNAATIFQAPPFEYFGPEDVSAVKASLDDTPPEQDISFDPKKAGKLWDILLDAHFKKGSGNYDAMFASIDDDAFLRSINNVAGTIRRSMKP